eukprot:gene3349-3838_t
MGHCMSKIGPESEAQETTTKNKKRITILILGTPNSGKSTIMRQFRILYGDGFTSAERLASVSVIATNIIESVSTCIGQIDEKDMETRGPKTIALSKLLQTKEDAETVATKHTRNFNAKDFFTLTEEVWCAENLQEDFQNQKYSFRARISEDGYFLKRIKEINNSTYIPTDDDLLHMRKITEGVEEFKFTYRNCDFTVIDVGGAKAERRRWINLFSRANMIIYCSSLIDYDLGVEKEQGANGMGDSLTVFESVVNLTYFKDTPLLLFLNKKDLLAKKVKFVDIKETFLDYKGSSDNSHEIVNFLQLNFLNKIKDQSRPVKVHVISATNTRDVKKAFEISLDWVLELKK